MHLMPLPNVKNDHCFVMCRVYHTALIQGKENKKTNWVLSAQKPESLKGAITSPVSREQMCGPGKPSCPSLAKIGLCSQAPNRDTETEFWVK